MRLLLIFVDGVLLEEPGDDAAVAGQQRSVGAVLGLGRALVWLDEAEGLAALDLSGLRVPLALPLGAAIVVGNRGDDGLWLLHGIVQGLLYGLAGAAGRTPLVCLQASALRRRCLRRGCRPLLTLSQSRG